MPIVTFKSLLWQLARDAGKNPDSTLGTVDLSASLQAMMLQWLTEALDYVWLDHAPYFTKPEITTSGLKSVTSNVISKTELESSPWVSVWTADPRTDDAATEVVAHFNSSGDVYLPDVSSGNVYVFWHTTKPQWTLTASVDASTYNIGDLVYHAATGDCYIALQNGLSGAGVGDESDEWAVQRAPSSLIQPLRDYARYKWLMSRELEKPAALALGKADAFLENLMFDIVSNRKRPWVRDSSSLYSNPS